MDNARLLDLYSRTSKHSQYQILAGALQKHVPSDSLKTCSRFERERLDYILPRVPIQGSSIVDIGGNTGFFTFELLGSGAKSVLLVEGNQTHCAFVSEAANVLGWKDRIQIHPEYMTFRKDLDLIDDDICILMNVLHHVGDDYDNRTASIDAAKQEIQDSLSRLASHAKFLIFQLGFNWKGNRALPLFETGTKAELIEFIRSATKSSWSILAIGIPEAETDGIVYRDLSAVNGRRQDELGEFLNRPLFIMKSQVKE